MVADSAIKSLENLCRTCMGERKTEVIPNNTRQEVKSLISIYHKHETKDSGNITIMELLKQTSPKLTLDADDMLPKHICENCLDVLVNVHEFQKKSLKVEQRLRNIVKEHYSSHEMDVDPLNINKVKHAEGDLKIEIDEPISDVTTPLRGFFTLIQKDGNIIEVYNDLEKSDLVVSDGNEKCETGDNIGGKRKPQFNTAASETRNNENDELLDIKFWKYIEEDYSIDIPVMKEHTSKEGKPVNGEVNNHLHKYDQDEKRVDKIMRKSNRDLGNISGNSNNRKQKRDDEDLNSEGRHQPTIPICNDMKEVAEEESLKSEVSDSTEISVEGKSEWEPTLDKSQSFMRKSIESDSKLEGNFELKNGDKKVNSVKLDNRGFPCNECGKPLKTSLGLKRHLQIQHSADNGHICPECGMRLKTRITFRRHLSRHEKDEAKIKYKCQYCNKIFYQTSALRCHVRTHTGERPYLCSVCGKSFPTIYSLNLHSQLHGTEFNYQCPECPKRFRCKSNMTTHKAIVHSTARPHVCDVCGASFKKPYGLTKHKINHGEKKHKCDYCELRFSHPNQCQRHMRTHTGEKPYKCKYCEISYSQSNEVMKHLRVHLGDNVYRCEMCPQAFRMLSELRVHFNSHKDDDEETKSQNLQALQEEEKRILTKIERAKATEQQSTFRKSNRDLEKISGDSNKRKQKSDDKDVDSEWRHQPTIPICNDMKEVAEEESLKSEVSDSNEISVEDKGEWEPTLDKSQSFMCKSIESDSKLEGNLELKHGDKKVNSVKLDNRGFPCNECGKRFKTSLGLKRHLQIQHSADNGHICPECGMRLKTRIAFRRHLSTHEKDETKNKYKCQYCNKIFYKSSALRCHERTHTGERPYLCSVCGKSFPTIYSLNLHSQLHGTEFNYQCPECPKRFRCKSNMTTHKAIVHSTARPHVCDVCGASFKKPYGLTKHKINHGEKKHKCDYCELRFSHPDQCRRHMRRHTGEKPYKCKYCEISYSQSNEVMKHLRVHLGDNVYRCEMCPQAFRMLSELRVHFNSHKDDDEETKSQNLQALQEEEKRILSKIERAKATEQQS